MQVEHVARICLATRRALQQQTHGTVGNRVLREVVIDNQHVATLVHVIFRHRAARVRRNVLHGVRFARRCADDDAVVHCVAFAQILHQLGNARCLLTDGNVHADNVLALLIQHGVQRNRRFARLTVADNQFALTAANREHGVDGQQPCFHRRINTLTVDDARRGFFHWAIAVRRNRVSPVNRASERVHHAAKERVAHGNTRGLARARNLAARGNIIGIVKQDAACLVAAQILHHAFDTVVEHEDFAIRGMFQPLDNRNAVADGLDCPDFAALGKQTELVDAAAQKRDDVLARVLRHKLLHLLAELLHAALRAPVVDLAPHMQLEAALQRRILLDGQRNIFAILFLEEGADALLLMLIRRRDAKQRGRQTALLRISHGHSPPAQPSGSCHRVPCRTRGRFLCPSACP